MYQLIQTIILFLLFMVAAIFVFYVPGFGIIARSKKKLEDQEIITLSLSLGFVCFVLAAIILSLLRFRDLMYLIILVVNLLIILQYRFDVFKSWKIFIKCRTLLILIILGIFTQGFINFPSGYLYKDGLDFWSSQGHDGIWHISLMEEVKKEIPIKSPIFAGENLYNYHYLVDILMGEFARIFPFFSTLDLYFRFFPVIFSLLIGISVFALITRWQQNNKVSGYFAVFFTYFVGSFGYIVTFLRNRNIFAGETVFWASQENTLLGNPPHAISHGLLAACFLAILIYLKERKLIWLAIAFLIGFVLAGFKVSGGLVMLAGISAAAIIDFICQRRVWLMVLAFLLGLSNFITFRSMTSNDAPSFLMFLPWWFIRTMVVDKLGWMDIELKRQFYISKGSWHAWLRVFQLEAIAFTVFLIGNLGMRTLGFFTIIKNIFTEKSYKKPFEVMLMVAMITGFVIPILFVQKGIIYNNIQFMQYFLFIMGFYGAITIFRLIGFFKNMWIKILIVIVVAVLSLPTVIGNLNEFYGIGRTPLAKISNQDLEALRYLKEHSNQEAIILTTPFNRNLKDKFSYQPKPIYVWYSTAYIPALTGRRMYLTDEEQALITGYQIENRIIRMKKFFQQNDFSFNRTFLKDAKIDYIYITKNELESLDIQKNGLSIFFENNEIVIYKVITGKEITTS